MIQGFVSSVKWKETVKRGWKIAILSIEFRRRSGKDRLEIWKMYENV